MKTIHLLVGTTLGGAEYVADALVPYIEQAGFSTEIHNPADLGTFNTDEKQLWLVVTSTHGAGDYPESFQDFANQLMAQRPMLREIFYGVIGIGDSSYDTFCEAGKNIDALLQDLGAVQTSELLTIDVQEHAIPEDAAEAWIPNWLNTVQKYSQ